jgi:prepilin-type N-terminal cleavage/methylation domain-containing protein
LSGGEQSQRGLTLVELLIALTLLAGLSLALSGTISIGARSAGSAERRTEQARRFRIATDLIVRQLRSAAPLLVLAENEDDEDTPIPYFFGEQERVSFVTAMPQAPENSGYALVEYWLDGEVLMMSELPYFATFAGDVGAKLDHLKFAAPLLLDVGSLSFEYRRSSFDTDTWSGDWDAEEEDSLPAVVRIVIEPAKPDGPSWYHEVPIFVGVYNEITGEDDFTGS